MFPSAKARQSFLRSFPSVQEEDLNGKSTWDLLLDEVPCRILPRCAGQLRFGPPRLAMKLSDNVKLFLNDALATEGMLTSSIRLLELKWTCSGIFNMLEKKADRRTMNLSVWILVLNFFLCWTSVSSQVRKHCGFFKQNAMTLPVAIAYFRCDSLMNKICSNVALFLLVAYTDLSFSLCLVGYISSICRWAILYSKGTITEKWSLRRNITLCVIYFVVGCIIFW